mgnify:CR=1 FL=1
MKRILYHGSPNIIEKPIYGFGNKQNDYGLGFYCTTSKTLAKEWASKRTGFGYVNSYSFRDDNYKILDLTAPPYNNVLYWVALLMSNREISDELKTKFPRELKYLEDNYLIDISKYDIVIGFRADDSYFSYMNSFLENNLSVEALSKAMKLGKLGLQYVAISKKAHKKIKFISAERIEYSDKYEKLQKEIKNEYLKIKSEDKITNTFIRDIMRRYEKDV